ncbi:hypothetical protein PTTG_28518, partial [Puccinia triticina 1-1 BBBD Race 1]
NEDEYGSSSPPLPKAEDVATALALAQLPEAASELPTALEEDASTSPQVPKAAEDDASNPAAAQAFPQLPEADSELPTTNEVDGLSSPPLPKAKDDTSDPGCYFVILHTSIT